MMAETGVIGEEFGVPMQENKTIVHMPVLSTQLSRDSTTCQGGKPTV